MEIVENKALRIRTRNPEKFKIIPKHHVQEIPGGFEVTMFWGLDEVRVLRNLGVKSAPSPIERKYVWPGRYKPMSHQRTTAGFLTLNRRAFNFGDPGTGKTMSVLWAADYLMTRGDIRRVLVICPLSIMQTAWLGDITNSIMHRSAVVCHHTKASRRIEMLQDNYEFVIINYDGLALVANEVIADGRFDLVIVDECFVAGTPVDTPTGPRSIETLVAGELVLTSSGEAPILRVIRNTSADIVTVRTSDGKEITCTADHPFFTDAGWITARNLVGRRLVRTLEMPDVRNGVLERKVHNSVASCAGVYSGDDLFAILRAEEVSRPESGSLGIQPFTTRSARRSDRDGALRRAEGAYFSDTKSQGAQASGARGERYRDDILGEPCGTFTARTLGMELPRSVGATARGLSYQLQTRLRASPTKGGFGGGRELPQYVGKEASGSKEGDETGGTWVVSVTHHKQGRATPVFNIEVEGTPHYFANGHLVHNCNSYGNASTNRWKALAKILRPDTFLWMMTGTPAAQSPLGAYGLAKLVNPSAVPKYMTAWRDKVMNKITTFKWAPKATAKDTVFSVLQPAIRFAKADCLDLPPVVKLTREVAMTAQQKKYYDKIKNEMLVVAAGQTISAVNKAAVVGKLLQISCGAVYTEDHEVVEFDATPRMNLLLEILSETDRKVLIFAMFRSSIESIKEFLGKHNVSVECIHGGIAANKRGDIINRFQHKPEPRVLLMQPQATAHGITLTAADTVVFFGPLMSVELYTQAIARSDRKGQTSDKVTVIHIQSSPIEKKMFAAMDAKVTDHALLTQMFDEEIT